VLEDCAALGARVHDCGLDALPESAEELASHAGLTEACEQLSAPAMLVLDGASFFSGAGAGRAGMSTCLELAWSYTRIVVADALLPRALGGRVIYLAPPPHAGPSAEAARAGLENLARTLSIEWARHSVTTVAIAPGASTSSAELAALAAYLASPAGAYFSGCLLDLTGPGR
jgi:NAD(P)-dependent dehydrogenase (short-subunit alcohol dehydrogenase family)